MASDHFSEKPQPPKRTECPRCGEPIPADTERCWLCRENVADIEDVPSIQRKTVSRGVRDEPVWIVFGVLVVLLILAMVLETPAALIGLLIIAIPALVRTIVIMNRANVPTAGENPGMAILLFLSSLGVSALVGIAAFSAFCVAFVGACTVGLPLIYLSEGFMPLVMLLSCVAGAAVAILVAVRIFKSNRPRA